MADATPLERVLITLVRRAHGLRVWYHAIAYLANGARVELEPWAARFPDVTNT
jgi:hypothetical protein